MGEEGQKITGVWQKTVVILTAMVLVAAIVIIAILRDRIVNQQFKNVTVTGQGKIAYTPDLAIVTLGVQIDKAAKPEDALNQLNAKVANIIKSLKAAGVLAANIQTQNYSLYAQYDYKDNISVVSGYNANEQLVVKVTGYDKNQNKLNQVVAAASQAGANQVSSLTFDASNINDLKQAARIMALQDAKAKSAALAAAAGVQLGEITGWYENLINPAPDSGGGTDTQGAKGSGGGGTVSPQLPSGDQEVIMEIGLTYNIK